MAMEGCKRTFSLGKRVSIPGKLSRTPLGVLAIGQVESNWFNRACAPSRAVAASSSSRFSRVERINGFGSEARRRPRSKVYGVGFVTTTGSLEGPVGLHISISDMANGFAIAVRMLVFFGSERRGKRQPSLTAFKSGLDLIMWIS